MPTNRPPRSRAKHWCFTCNNYGEADLLRLRQLGDSEQVQYLVYGRELAPTTRTPHLQGLVSFPRPRDFGVVQRLLPQSHIEVLRSKPSQHREYCIKDGNFEEFGECPNNSQQGKRSDWNDLKDWFKEQCPPPTETEIAERFPALYGRNRESVLRFRDLFSRFPVPDFGETSLRPWQSELNERLNRPPDDRTIEFIVDYRGNTGKSWFCEYYMSLHDKQAQYLRVAKRDDLAYAINPECRVFFFDVPRKGAEYLQYVILESLKDRKVFSPKYGSRTKRIAHNVHVIVFMNEDPDSNALSNDRYEITYIN